MGKDVKSFDDKYMNEAPLEKSHIHLPGLLTMDKYISLLMRKMKQNPAQGITGLYVLATILWIVFSDLISLSVTTDIALLTQIQMAKGIIFVVFTATILYLVLKKLFDRNLKSEQRLYQSNDRYMSLLESSSDCMWEMDKNFIYTYVSPKIKDFLGFEPEEVLGMSPTDLMLEEEVMRVRKIFRQASSTRSPIVMLKNINLHENGQQVILETSGVPILDDNNKLQGYRGINRDITRRQHNEDEAKELERKFMTLLGNLKGVAYRCRNDHNWSMEFLSNHCYELTGYHTADLLSNLTTAYNDIILKEDRDQVWESVQSKISIGLPFQVEYRIKTFSGEIKWVREQGIGISDSDKKITAIEGFITDITESKKAEEENEALQNQLTQAQKMEAIGTLAGGIAHDFNNILSPIIGYTELAIEALSESTDNQSVSKDLQAVLSASVRAKELVKQILSFSHHSDHKREPVQIHLIVNEAIKLLHASLPSTIEIRQNIDSNSGYVLADATQVHQVVLNLCTNAYHAMRETGGVLEVSLEATDVSMVQANLCSIVPGDYIRLGIKDTGHGISEKTMERMFEPYFTTKLEDEGTGLGLSVAHGIIRSHDGGITVNSTLGEGSQFVVYFPRVNTAKIGQAVEILEQIPHGNERILLIDDEALIVQMETSLLENLGYKVTAVTSSDKALQTFQANPDDFDLTISDMTMPHMTGADLAVKFHNIRPNMPFILCTGFSENINEYKAKEIGIQEYIKKPVHRKEMALVVRRALDNSINYHRVH